MNDQTVIIGYDVKGRAAARDGGVGWTAHGLSLMSSTAGEIMEDLLDSSGGHDVAERDISPSELGLSPAELDQNGQIVLAVIRDGVAHPFDTDTIRTLAAGDRLVVIRHNPGGE